MAVAHGGRGVYNVVDDDPTRVAEWLPALAKTLGAKKPIRATVHRTAVRRRGRRGDDDRCRRRFQRQGQARASVVPGAPGLAARVRNDLSHGDGAQECPGGVNSSDGQEPENGVTGSMSRRRQRHTPARSTTALGTRTTSTGPDSRRDRRARSCSARFQEACWRCPVDHRGQPPHTGEGRQRECHSGGGCLVLRDTGHPRQRC